MRPHAQVEETDTVAAVDGLEGIEVETCGRVTRVRFTFADVRFQRLVVLRMCEDTAVRADSEGTGVGQRDAARPRNKAIGACVGGGGIGEYQHAVGRPGEIVPGTRLRVEFLPLELRIHEAVRTARQYRVGAQTVAAKLEHGRAVEDCPVADAEKHVVDRHVVGDTARLVVDQLDLHGAAQVARLPVRRGVDPRAIGVAGRRIDRHAAHFEMEKRRRQAAARRHVAYPHGEHVIGLRAHLDRLFPVGPARDGVGVDGQEKAVAGGVVGQGELAIHIADHRGVADVVGVGAGGSVRTAVLSRQKKGINLAARAIGMRVDLRDQYPALRVAVAQGGVVEAAPEIGGKGVIPLLEVPVDDEVGAGGDARAGLRAGGGGEGKGEEEGKEGRTGRHGRFFLGVKVGLGGLALSCQGFQKKSAHLLCKAGRLQDADIPAERRQFAYQVDIHDQVEADGEGLIVG